jgi:hypothetical protein
MNENETRQTWIYGIVPASASLKELERRDRLPEVSLVETGDLAAIIGEKPEDDARATRDQALAHARVLEAAIVDAPVVPMRFGTIVEGGDEEVGGELLEAHQDEFSELLKRFENHVQMTLKVSYREDAVLREILDSEPEAAQLREQSRKGPESATRDAKVQLGELISTALEQRRERDSADILERLKPVSVSAVADPIESEFMAMNMPFLVERDQVEKFEDAVEEVAGERQARMEFVLRGPMPVFSFLEMEEPAWA